MTYTVSLNNGKRIEIVAASREAAEKAAKNSNPGARVLSVYQLQGGR